MPSVDIGKKGTQIFRAGGVRKEIETPKRVHFTVSGETEEHSVIFSKITKKFSCDCKYFALKQKECSHIFACRLEENEA